VSRDVLTQERWDARWGASDVDYDPTTEPQLRDSLRLILRFWPRPKGRFLEAGCGPGANALNLALLGVEVAGVDTSPEALRRAEDAFARRRLGGTFVVGDVREIPFPDGSFDFVYAGGVVEHFVETRTAVAEMARVLRPGGRLLLTVPALTLSYPYLFLRGNVPAVPVIEEAARFVQFRLLSGALATFGYERSFRKTAVRQLLKDAELAAVDVGRFDTYMPLLKIPPPLRGFARRLARVDLFAPMYYGTGTRHHGPRADRTG
jgi:SAM-dependent methyltransferase